MFAWWVSCSMLAARKVSPAARTVVCPACLRKLAIFEMLVVLPVPFTPKKRITNGLLAILISSRGLSGSMMSSFSEFFSWVLIVCSSWSFLISLFMSFSESLVLRSSTTSSATLFSSNNISKSS